MSDQLDMLPLTEDRTEIRTKIARLWLNEIANQPMSLAADNGLKVTALAELTLRLIEEAGYVRVAA